MKGERILYVILILIALVTGIYGYTSGLLTPHHYYKIEGSYGDCRSPDGMIYINKRENYLVFSSKAFLEAGKFSIVEDNDNFIKWEYFYKEKDIERVRFESILITQAKDTNYFEISGTVHGTVHGGADKFGEPGIFTIYKTCSVTKQFLQRN